MACWPTSLSAGRGELYRSRQARRGWQGLPVPSSSGRSARRANSSPPSCWPRRPRQSPCCAFKPGQYLSIKLVHPNWNIQEIANTLLSDAPNGRDYRIGVKREPQGRSLNLLHDQLHIGDEVAVMPPAEGDFFLQTRTTTQWCCSPPR